MDAYMKEKVHVTDCDRHNLLTLALKLDLKIEPSAFASGKPVSKMTKEMEDLFAARFGTHP